MSQPRKSIKFALLKNSSPLVTPKKTSISFAKQDKKDNINNEIEEEEKNNFDYNLFQFNEVQDHQHNNFKNSGHQVNLNTSNAVGKHFISGSQNPFYVLTEGVVKIGEFLEQQKRERPQNWSLDEEIKNEEESGGDQNDDIEFSDTSFLQLSVIVGDDQMQNTGRINLAPQHTLETQSNEKRKHGQSDVTDMGREILANIVSDDKNRLRIERSRIEFDDDDADDLERDIGMLRQRPSNN